MKLRNVRRRQWERCVDQLGRLSDRLPQREADNDPFASTDPILVVLPGYYRMHCRWEHRKQIAYRDRLRRTARWVEHDCVWESVDLPIDAAGNTAPGYQCTYQLENGMGECGSNVFNIEDAIGKAACIVRKGGDGW